MKTLVLTGADANMAEIHAITVEGKRRWAAAAGYDFHELRQWNSDSPIVWQKMAWVQRGLRDYDTVIWLDADALLTNLDARLEDFMPDAQAAMFISADWGDCAERDRPFHFNTGNFVTRRIPEVTEVLFAEMWELGRAKWWDRWGYEQSTLQEIKRTRSILGELIHVLPGRALNAVPRAAQPGANNNNPWAPGDFLAHLTGISNVRRLELLRNQEWRE